MKVLQAGDEVDRYRVERTLGRGAQAVVYQVRHRELGVVRALKVVEVEDPATRARLLTEGRVLAALRHPNVVGVVDVLEVHEAPALLLEYVGGGSVQELLARRQLTLAEVENIFVGVLAGVEAVHEARVVHRDLKPANVLLDDTSDPPVARVADFGVARLLDGADHPTRVGVGLGSPGFMAPEQARGASDLDTRADVWSLGALLYALLTGRSPFQGGSLAEVLAAAASGHHPPVADLRADTPPRWVTVVESCLRVAPHERPPDVAAVAALFRGTASPPVREADTWSGETTGSTVEVPRAASGPGVAQGLVVDPSGDGHAVEVVVVVEPGEGAVVAGQACARDAEVAAQVAVAAALGAVAGRRRVTWQVRGAGHRVSGTSLALAIAVGTLSAERRVPLPSGVSFTGGVDLDGRIATVGGLPAKLRAARAAGHHQVWAPPGSPGLDGVDVRRPGRLGEVVSALLPSRAPGRGWVLLAGVVLPALAVFLGATDAADGLIQAPLLRAAGRAVRVDQVVVAALPATADLRALRGRWPAWLDRLAAAGATAILADVTFTAETDEDARIAACIRRLPIPVILPVSVEDEVVHRPGNADLAAAARLGHAVSLTDLGSGVVRGARLRLYDGPEDLWHVSALTAAAAVRAPDPPSLQDGRLTLGPLVNAAGQNAFRVAPAGAVSHVDIDGDLGGVRGKVVVVGALRGDRDLHRTLDGPRYGSELLAVEVETLLRQAAPREASPELGALYTVIVTLASALLPRGRAVPALVATLLGVALATGGLLMPFLAPLLGSLVVTRVPSAILFRDRRGSV